jgi:multidrug efflux system membrane fusion protein
VKPDSTLDLRPVKPGQPQGDFTVINDGLKTGETVVVSGQLQLAPGTKVVAQPIETPAENANATSNAALN